MRSVGGLLLFERRAGALADDDAAVVVLRHQRPDRAQRGHADERRRRHQHREQENRGDALVPREERDGCRAAEAGENEELPGLHAWLSGGRS